MKQLDEMKELLPLLDGQNYVDHYPYAMRLKKMVTLQMEALKELNDKMNSVPTTVDQLLAEATPMEKATGKKAKGKR